MSDPDSVAALIDGIVERHGRLDAAHSNAGIRGVVGAFDELAIDEWNRMIAANLTGVFLCMQRELTVMASAGRGVIINTSSGAGVIGYPGLPHDVAAKHGVIGLRRASKLAFSPQARGLPPPPAPPTETYRVAPRDRFATGRGGCG